MYAWAANHMYPGLTPTFPPIKLLHATTLAVDLASSPAVPSAWLKSSRDPATGMQEAQGQQDSGCRGLRVHEVAQKG